MAIPDAWYPLMDPVIAFWHAAMSVDPTASVLWRRWVEFTTPMVTPTTMASTTITISKVRL